jgi:hypothetical protein
MKKYVLIEVIDRNINLLPFDTWKEAYDNMKTSFDKIVASRDVIASDFCEEDYNLAWVNDEDGNGFDWGIFEIEI